MSRGVHNQYLHMNNSLKYRDLTNTEIAKLEAYSVTFDCEKAKHMFEEEFNKESPPSRTLRDWKKRYLETLSILPRSHAGDQTPNKIPDEKKQAIVTAFGDGQCNSQRQASKRFNVALSSVNSILKENEMYPFKFIKVQQLHDDDPATRLEFCRTVLERNTVDANWSNKIIFSDEVTLNLNGEINHHNSFYYSQTNQHLTYTKSLKSASITVWAMIPADGRLKWKILNETMNSERYIQTLNEIVLPCMNSNRYVHHMFQQDGASVHFARDVRNLLDQQIPHRWIGRGGPITWPPRSPDLSVCDFWLWGYLRDIIFKHPKPTTIGDLSTRVENCLANIDHTMVKNSFKNFIKRCRLCIDNDGQHFEQFL